MDNARGQPIILPAGPIFLRERTAIGQALLERRIPSIAAFRAGSNDCGHLFRLKADSDSDRSRTTFR
jgi:hypothetical protein